MLIDKAILGSMLTSAANLWKQNTDQLSDIDSKYGDGDHGITIGKIADLTATRVSEWGEQSIKQFIEALGFGIVAIRGGSAGPLYGTMVEGLAGPLTDEGQIDADMLKAMLRGMQDAMAEITKAKVGDKTMMDAMLPAVEAAQKAEGDIPNILAAAANAARKGAEATKDMVSKFGRARSYGEQTIGTMDAGAVSTALFFEGICQGVQ